MKRRRLQYILLIVSLIVIGLLTWNLINVWRDQIDNSLIEASTTASPQILPSMMVSQTSTLAPTYTATASVTKTTIATNTSTRTATRIPTKTVTNTPRPAPIVVKPTNTPGPTGEGYVEGTPWDYDQTPVYTPGVP